MPEAPRLGSPTRDTLLLDLAGAAVDLLRFDASVAAREERSLLEGMTTYRAAFTGRDPVTPAAHWDGQRYHVRFPDGSVRTLDPPEQPVVPVPVMLLPSYR